MHIGVIGAGPAGLCAVKHAISPEYGMLCTVFEQCETIGGTWNYTDLTGHDKYGIPIHTSMYRDLRINIPKEIVHFPGYPHKKGPVSYITSEEILEYLCSYADTFNLWPHIKLNHHVKKVQPLDSEKWEVTVQNLTKNEENVYIFDAVIVCNGLNNVPRFPKIKGMEKFIGKSMHSHDYRHTKPFLGQRVLIIGAGPSAMDLADQICHAADKVFISHHSTRMNSAKYGENVVMKPDMEVIKENSAVFTDGSEEEIDTILYCTGYLCSYPFLTEDCGIYVENRYVYPLYKFCINAHHPTMCILGNLCFSMQLPTFDIQVRFFLKTLTDSILPSTAEMLEDVEECTRKKANEGSPKSTIFVTTAQEDEEYYRDIAGMAKIESIPKVMCDIHGNAIHSLYSNFPLFRNNIYNIIDNNRFEIICPQ